MHCTCSKIIRAYNPVVVTTYIKYYPVTAFPKEVSRAECFFNICRNFPICQIYQGQPMIKGNSSTSICCRKINNGLPFDQSDSHFIQVEITKSSQNVNYLKIKISLSKLEKISCLGGS